MEPQGFCSLRGRSLTVQGALLNKCYQWSFWYQRETERRECVPGWVKRRGEGKKERASTVHIHMEAKELTAGISSWIALHCIGCHSSNPDLAGLGSLGNEFTLTPPPLPPELWSYKQATAPTPLVRFSLSRWHKLKSYGKRESSLRDCLHKITWMQQVYGGIFMTGD